MCLPQGKREGQVSLKERTFPNFDIEMDPFTLGESVGIGGGGDGGWGGKKDRSSCTRGLGESKERGREPPMYIWKKCRDKEFDEEELFSRQVRNEGLSVQGEAYAEA